MRNIGLMILTAAALTGCETGPSRQQVLASLVGQPESTALRILGAPNHIVDANGHSFLAYEDSGVGYVPTSPFGPYGFYYGPSAFPVVRTCTMTVEVVRGQVASWNLRGNGCE